MDPLIGCRTKHWVQTSVIQHGGAHAIQGWKRSFLLSRLSKAVQDSPMLLVNVMCTAKVNLSAWRCRSIFRSLRETGPTHISLIRLRRLCSHKQLALRPIRSQCPRLHILSLRLRPCLYKPTFATVLPLSRHVRSDFSCRHRIRRSRK